MKKNSLSEFEMEKEGFKIKLRRAASEGKPEEVQVQHYLPPAAPAAPIPAEAPVAAPVPEQSTEPEIKSALIGTFSRKPSPRRFSSRTATRWSSARRCSGCAPRDEASQHDRQPGPTECLRKYW